MPPVQRWWASVYSKGECWGGHSGWAYPWNDGADDEELTNPVPPAATRELDSEALLMSRKPESNQIKLSPNLHSNVRPIFVKLSLSGRFPCPATWWAMAA
jgi:hypothetical protein